MYSFEDIQRLRDQRLLPEELHVCLASVVETHGLSPVAVELDGVPFDPRAPRHDLFGVRSIETGIRFIIAGSSASRRLFTVFMEGPRVGQYSPLEKGLELHQALALLETAVVNLKPAIAAVRASKAPPVRV